MGERLSRWGVALEHLSNHIAQLATRGVDKLNVDGPSCGARRNRFREATVTGTIKIDCTRHFRIV